MVTMKQIAQATGFSLSTVSIILRGIADERNIPKVTQEKVLEAAREMGYQPNVSARRLRSDGPMKQNIVIFWATDFRAVLMAKFLQGVQRYLGEVEKSYEVVICPYRPNWLSEMATQRNLSMYTGAIVCTASKTDLEHIENISSSCPIVLYNRISDKFPCVYVDNDAIGRAAAKILYKNNCTRAIVVADNSALAYARARVRGFAAELSEANVPVEILSTLDNSIAQGRVAGQEINITEDHTGVFTTSDNLGFGFLRGLSLRNIQIPQQVELISIGTNEPDLYQCFKPSITVVEIPIEQMAYECAKMLDSILESRTQPQKNIIVQFNLFPGESTL